MNMFVVAEQLAGHSHTHVTHVSHGTVKPVAMSCDELINGLVYNIKNVN